MRDALAVFAALVIITTACTAIRPSRRHTALLEAASAHSLTQSPGINYAGNPYRAGAYVYVLEASTPSEHDWVGTFIGMEDGYALVRDHSTHVVTHVNKDQIYSAQR